MTSKEKAKVNTEEIQRIFRRHIAKALTQMDLADLQPNIKSAVKNEMWNTCDDVLAELNDPRDTSKDGTQQRRAQEHDTGNGN